MHYTVEFASPLMSKVDDDICNEGVYLMSNQTWDAYSTVAGL